MNATTHSPAPFAVVGIVAAALFAVMWIVMAAGDPTWVLGENTLSDLGISIDDDVASMFKYTCIITGILVAVFGAGKAFCEPGASTASGVFTAFAGVLLILIGFFDKNYEGGDLHNMLAYLIFLFVALAAICSIFGDHAEGKNINSTITAALVLIVVGAIIGKELGYYEAVGVICALVWLAAESVKMILNINAPAPKACCACCAAAVEEAVEETVVEEASVEEEPVEENKE